MVVTKSPENAKKRKKDGDVCTIEDSPKKTAKVAHSPGGDHSLELSLHSESDDSQELSDDSSQSSVSSDESGGSAQKSFASLFTSCQLLRETDSQREKRVLKLDPKHVFTRLLVVFSQDNLPDKITYNGQGYNLTAAYDDFWKAFYSSSYHSEGYGIKIPNVKNLIDVELKALVKIIKRGWEDERYWPKKLARSFLEPCLFKESNASSITPEMFLEFIEPSEKASIQDQKNVDQNVLNIFRKYCSEGTVSEGDDIRDILIVLAHKIMVTNMKNVIDLWSKELTGIMPMSKFNFLMGPSPVPEPPGNWKLKEDDMVGYMAPHRLWNTFFYGWPEDKVKYYLHLLANEIYDSECNICGDSWFNAKHFICKCDMTLDTIRLDRHDAVLQKLLAQVNMAIERQSPYFGKGSDWKLLTSLRNVPYVWPEELSIMKSLFPQRYPHILVYSTSPIKRAIIIEYSISWEYWMHLSKDKKTRRYWVIKTLLEKIGFEVEYRVFSLGCRGVLVPDLYDLFEQIFGMKHSEISEALEDISQEILDIPYQSTYYKDLMKLIK